MEPQLPEDKLLSEYLIDETGIQLSTLARLINVKQPLLTMFHQNKRLLTVEGYLKLNQLYQTFQDCLALPDAPAQYPEEAFRKEYESCVNKKMTLEKKLQEGEKGYRRGQQLLKLAMELKSNIPQGDGRMENLIEILLDDALKTINKHLLQTEEFLRPEIEALEKKIALLGGKLGMVS